MDPFGAPVSRYLQAKRSEPDFLPRVAPPAEGGEAAGFSRRIRRRYPPREAPTPGRLIPFRAPTRTPNRRFRWSLAELRIHRAKREHFYRSEYALAIKNGGALLRRFLCVQPKEKRDDLLFVPVEIDSVGGFDRSVERLVRGR